MKNKEFNIFVNNTELAYKQFCIWRTLKENERAISLFRETFYFWRVISISLIIGYLSELAKIFEKPESKYGDVLSIYYFMGHEFKEHEKTIDKIRKLRHKILMHSDVKKQLDIHNFLKEIDLKLGEIEDLLIKLIEVIDSVKNNFGIKENLSKQFNDVKKDCEREVIELITRYKE